MNLTLKYAELLPPVVRDELEQLVATLRQWAYNMEFGQPTGTWLTINPLTGIRIGYGDTTKVSVGAGGDATFAGSVTASSGTIGGWTIGADYLVGGNAGLYSAGFLKLGTGDDVAYVSASNSTYRLWVGKDDETTAPFRVTKAGAVTASDITISGGDITLPSYGSDGFYASSAYKWSTAFSDTNANFGLSAVDRGTGSVGDRTIYFKNTFGSRYDLGGGAAKIVISAVGKQTDGGGGGDGATLTLDNPATTSGASSATLEATGITLDGAVTLAAPPAFVANDKYLVIDASGNIHVSALGPAS